MEKSKVIRRLCGKRDAYYSKSSNKCLLIIFFNSIYGSTMWKRIVECCLTVTCDSCQRIIFQD